MLLCSIVFLCHPTEIYFSKHHCDYSTMISAGRCLSRVGFGACLVAFTRTDGKKKNSCTKVARLKTLWAAWYTDLFRLPMRVKPRRKHYTGSFQEDWFRLNKDLEGKIFNFFALVLLYTLMFSPVEILKVCLKSSESLDAKSYFGISRHENFPVTMFTGDRMSIYWYHVVWSPVARVHHCPILSLHFIGEQ